jgi:hypothetical protein
VSTSAPDLFADAAQPADLDPPLFDPKAFRLSAHTAALADRARALAQTVFAERAATYDREARFPTENYADLHKAGLLAICIRRTRVAAGADYKTYAIVAAEIGRYCGATALSWNMHVCSTLWSGAIVDDLDLNEVERAEHEARRALHYRRIVEDGAIYSQPFSEGRRGRRGRRGIRDAGSPDRGRLARLGQEDLRLARRPRRLLRHPLHGDGRAGRQGVPPQHALSRDPGQGGGRVGGRGLGPARHARHGLAHAHLQGRLRAGGRGADAARDVFPGASRWPHMFLTLSPTYVGQAQAAYDFTVRYLRGEQPGTPPVKRRQYPTKQIAVAEMRIKLEQLKAVWFQAISEAGTDPSKDQSCGPGRRNTP